MYLISEISNRDLSLLHCYRILRKPSDFLSAVYNEAEPELTEIYKGTLSEYTTETHDELYEYELSITSKANLIPYIEFETDNEPDRLNLANLICLDNNMIYGTISEFEKPVLIKVYWVSSLDSIRNAILAYLEALGMLNIDALKTAYTDKKNQPRAIRSIDGRNENLVRFTNSGDSLTMKDSGYMITSALEAQLLVNPSQELLMSLPRKLKHRINIDITDGNTRYLSSFSGYSINIKGNGSWVIRDVASGINFISGLGRIYLWNCNAVHFRSTVDDTQATEGYHCQYLHAHRSLVILNQGVIEELCLVGGSTLTQASSGAPGSYRSKINKVLLVGYGSSLYSWVGLPSVPVKNILGLIWSFNPINSDTELFIAGRRIDEVSNEHDAELNPNKILDYDVNNIHIRTGGD